MARGIARTPAATVDHCAARARLLKASTTRLVQVICPSGALLKGVFSPICKNISLHPSGKSSLQVRAIPSHTEGRIAIVTDAGWGAVDAAAFCVRRDCRAGFGL
jgi:hypothetical protein